VIDRAADVVHLPALRDDLLRRVRSYAADVEGFGRGARLPDHLQQLLAGVLEDSVEPDHLVITPARTLVQHLAVLAALAPPTSGGPRPGVQEARLLLALELGLRFGEEAYRCAAAGTEAGLGNIFVFLTPERLRSAPEQLRSRLDGLTAAVARGVADLQRHGIPPAGRLVQRSEADVVQAVAEIQRRYVRTVGRPPLPLAALHLLADFLPVLAAHDLSPRSALIAEACLGKAELTARATGYTGTDDVATQMARLGPHPRPVEVAAVYRVLTRKVATVVPRLLSADEARAVSATCESAVMAVLEEARRPPTAWADPLGRPGPFGRHDSSRGAARGALGGPTDFLRRRPPVPGDGTAR
jgi:hypothetical protein